MIRSRKTPRLAALLAVLCLVPWLAASAARGDASPFRQLAAKARSLVTVKFVLKVKMEGANVEREVDGEIACLLIGAEGLVLCSNTELGGYVGMMGMMMGGGQGMSLSATPSDLKVLIGDETTGREARLLARDSDRDLAWVRFTPAEGEALPLLDLADQAELAVGDTFYLVRRMDKFFGRAPIVTAGTVGAVISRPRSLLVPSEPVSGGFGLPIFTAEGKLVGVTVLQMPGAEDQAAGLGNGLSFLGQSTKLQDMVGGLILPAADLVKATALARESFPSEEPPPPDAGG